MSHASTIHPPAHHAPRAHRRRAHGHHAQVGGAEETRKSWATLVLVAIAQFMVILDVTVVNVALPSIGSSIGITGGDLQWVVSAYVLFTGALMMFGGRMSDLLGRRQVFLGGLSVFTLASLASGVAWSPESLIVARSVQGVGAAMLLPSALSIITTTYSGAQRTAALGIWGALGGAGVAVGAVIGGVLVTTLSWRWIFFINVPTGILVAAHARSVIASTSRTMRTRSQLDLPGAVTLVVGLLCLVYSIESISSHGWSSTTTLVSMAVAATFIAAFVGMERISSHPLVPSSIWRVRSLTASTVVMLTATSVMVGSFFLTTLYMQNVMNFSALEAGLAFLPPALVILVAAHVVSHLVPRIGTRPLMVAGLSIAVVGALLLSRATGDGQYLTDLLPGFLAIGFGIGTSFVTVSIVAMSDIDEERAGLASGLMTTTHELGAALGVAVLGAVVAAGGMTPEALIDGFGTGFHVAAGIAATAAVVAAVAVPTFRPAAGTRISMH